MNPTTAFDRFASVILKNYRRDREAFWKAVMAPFLVNQISFLSWLGNIRVDIGFSSAFQGLDELARQLRDDQPRVRRAYECSKAMIDQSYRILSRLEDDILGRFVGVTDVRLEAYSHKELKMQ